MSIVKVRENLALPSKGLRSQRMGYFITQPQVGWSCGKEGGPCVLSDSLRFNGFLYF